ncbi:uncharacterized protein LOC127813490 [Diospyros lotus]|uniref:uncharacterized protein LOC127813490 n=1 Tax=Diospyros lotus TaxID=55363 RepID=UPI00225A7E87|nr:uncharacterized protein LOC127813490 [Diospyros lotus]
MSDLKRWSVTYTKHIKQKRKVYQDGFLELHGSIHKVLLYDNFEKLLDSRILKKDEVVQSDETLAFDAYLVDIGDLDGNHKPIPNLNFQGRDQKINEKAGLFHGRKFKTNPVSAEEKKTNPGKKKSQSKNLSPSQKIIREFKKNEINKYRAPGNSPVTINTSCTEWQVLYTAQITQKAKRYHDGILRVTPCGSQMKQQATLLNEDGTNLSCKYLKLSDDVTSGSSFELPNYLVEVGELLKNHEGEASKDAHPGKDVESNFTSPRVDNFRLRRTIPIDKPLRGANEIMSVLRKSMPQHGGVSVKRVSVEQCHVSGSTGLLQFGTLNQKEGHVVQHTHCNRVEDIHDKETNESQNLGALHDDHSDRTEADNHDGKTSKRHNLGAHCDDLEIQIVKPADTECRGEPQGKYFTLSNFSLGSEASDMPSINLGVDCTNNILKQASSIEEPQAPLDCPNDYQAQALEGNFLELMSPKGKLLVLFVHFSESIT